ncbi:MAG TPA: 16S rRNA (guanine(966)-N(2))-methyltransferase RsmD [Rhizomicrobium sp.]|nr:16S rRNA (guanine(966)-N(2))-methyltransferase RsmD [Rhizomicrobium sp.]
MRLTGGRLGGRTLFAPASARVRPTSDKVRQAIFNILEHNDFGTGFSLAGARLADLFAGTGAMGIEAVSRGARYCLFVEESAESRALIRKNIEALELTGATKIWRRDATKLGPMPAGSGGPFDLVLLDPPYRKNLIPPALTSLAEGGWLAAMPLLVAEMAEDESLAELSGFQMLDQRIYGDTRVVFLWPGRRKQF